ncbi:MAG TPA: CHAT domain-containing protein [Pyrinomonadaceae bacterium]|nr:CHAT domain-containing protein [Pyrinomonadaceae bacterium]
MSIIVCRPKSLPLDKLVAAERRALEVNPENALERRMVTRTPTGRRGGPRRIAVVIARKWPASGVRLSVSFLDNPSAALRSRILLHMNAWGEHANVRFAETQGVGKVRIARLDSPPDMAGYWSYVGTEILDAEEDEPTLNLEGFTMRVSEAEFRRVVRHEAGHTLGFDHEHMRSDLVKRIDRKKAFAYFDRTEGWTPEEVEEQVLTPLAKKSIMGTKESDPLSIMCYQLPGAIMKDGKPIPGGLDINQNDFAFAKIIYPKPERRTTETAEPEEPKEEPKKEPRATAFAATAVEAGETFELVVMDEFLSGIDSPRAAGSKPKFAQVFATYCGARVMSVMQLKADKGEAKTRFGQIIGVHERIKAYTNREHGSLPDDEEMIAFGSQLFDTLFQGDVRRLYDEARTRQRSRLDVVLTSMIPWIAEKPWEFAYDHGRKSFLATEETHFIRNVLTNVPADQIIRADGPLRILVVSAQPVGYGLLSVEQELAVIRRGFEPLIDAGLVEIEPLARATPSMIHGRLMTEKYQVVHFIGHGVYDEERGEGRLIFVNENGGEYSLGERSVREIFRGRGLSLVFLNACESGRGGRADFNKGVAQSLVARGLPALVANQYSVLDSSATSFAQHFYWSLAQGMSLGQSAREARIAVNYLLHGEPIDWAVPVLYARDPNATLCAPPKTPVRTPTTGVRASARRATAAHVARVAVWDMDNVFPALDKTVEAMNRAQGIFGFELVDVSVPLGVWDLDTAPGTPYLWAERLARRLQRMPMELGVEVLACVTRHWMRDDEWFNLYGWWPGERTPPIIIYSVAGFDEMAPEGPDTDRALANALVAGLAGFYGNADSHEEGAQDCPLAFNESRDFKQVVGRQKFDAACRKKLKPKLGVKLDALEALLKTFPTER